MNLEEVARRAKVSTATVSRVLNNADVVRPATRLRVMKAITDLNYHPNLHARSLAAGKSRSIGMIASNMANPFFFDIFRTLESAAHERGFDVFLANTNYEAERLRTSLRLMAGRRVAGLAVMVSEMEPAVLDELVASRIPVVTYDAGSRRESITDIRINYRRGTEKTVEYLRTLGHDRIAFVGHHSSLSPLNERRRTVLEAVERYSPNRAVECFSGEDGLEGGRRACQDVLASGFKPTAIICVNDFMAVGVLKELREAGLRVPEDVSVTGFDNIKLSEFCYPALTTVHVPRDVIGLRAIEFLVPNPNLPNHTAGREVVIDPEFLIRESTGPAPRS